MALCLGLVVAALLGVAGPALAGQPLRVKDGLYNYPHELPADYVFRTDRTFSPWSRTAREALPPVHAAEGRRFAEQVHSLTRSLLASAREDAAEEYTVAVSSFVNLNRLYATSALGRYLGEEVLGELQRAGVEVVEVRKTPGMLISKGNGEYSLSRDMGELDFVQQAQAVVVGTYSIADGQLFLNTRLVRNQDNRVLASASMVLPLGGVGARLLADEAMPRGRGVRVEVRGGKP